MAVPLEKFVQQLEDSGIVAGDTLKDFIPPTASPKDAEELAKELIRQKKLTKFQAEEVSKGKGKSLVLGNYVLLEQIGAGGMGQVFKAEHRRMHRMVAIKLLPPAMTKDNAAIARFEREVTAAAKLRHPNIVASDDADCANGVHFLVMECVEGSDLCAVVKKNGPFPVAQAINYVLQAARGLEFAHNEGVVHRDIKPANLLLDKKGTVKILDMGLARLYGDGGGPQQAELTSTGTIMGTVDYMSPEQALDTKTADARADIYALGCSLHYLLTGKATYDGDTLMKKLIAHREHPVPSLRSARAEVPESVERIFKKMIAKKVEDRYQTMADVIHDLQSCSGPVSSTGVNVPPGSENTQFSSSSNAVGGQPTKSMKGIRPHQATATLTAAQAAAEATLLTGDAVPATHPSAQSLAAWIAGIPSEAKQKTPPSWWQNRRVQIGSGLAALLILMAGIVISLKTKHGTLIVEVDQPDAMVQVDGGERVHVSQQDGSDKVIISVDPGKHRLKVEKDGFTVFGQEFEMEKNGKKEITAKLMPLEVKPADVKPVVAAAREPLAFLTPGFAEWEQDVAGMPVEKQLEAVSKKLMELNPGFDGKLTNLPQRGPPAIEDGMLKQVRFLTDHVTDLSPVRALKGLRSLVCSGRKIEGPVFTGSLSDLSPLNGMKLTFIGCNDNPAITDFSPLAGMPLNALIASHTNVSDLTPLAGKKLTLLFVEITQVCDLSALKGMPIYHLVLNGTSVFDLSPLNGMPITMLSIAETPVFNLSPLAGMPLKDFRFHLTRVSDITSLQGMDLETIALTPKNITKGMDTIRKMKSIQAIYTDWETKFTPVEFWKKYDAGEFGAPIPQ